MAICRNCDKDNVLYDKFCDKVITQNVIYYDEDPVFRVKGKRIALLRSPEICHCKVIFQLFIKHLFYLE